MLVVLGEWHRLVVRFLIVHVRLVSGGVEMSLNQWYFHCDGLDDFAPDGAFLAPIARACQPDLVSSRVELDLRFSQRRRSEDHVGPRILDCTDFLKEGW